MHACMYNVGSSMYVIREGRGGEREDVCFVRRHAHHHGANIKHKGVRVKTVRFTVKILQTIIRCSVTIEYIDCIPLTCNMQPWYN